MKYIYIVSCCVKGCNVEKISSEGYNNLEKAINFIENRSYEPKQENGLIWIDCKGNKYKIHEIKII